MALAEFLFTEPSALLGAVRVLELARELTGSAIGCLGVLDTQQEKIVWMASEPASWCHEGREPLVLDPRFSLTRVHEGAARVSALGVSAPAGRRLRRLLIVPARTGGATVGQLVLADAPRPYGARAVEAVARLAGLWGAALGRERLAERLRWAQGELERRVAERTADLEKAKRELEEDIAARRRAEEEKAGLERELRQSRVLEAVGQLAGGVAHDFNNLLGSIIGCLYAAKMQTRGDAVLGEELDRAQSLCKRGGELTRQLLTVARRRPGRPELLEVAALFQEVQILLERTLPKAITLTIDLEPELPPVRADRSMFTAALLNLSLNAKDAMPRGGTLRISASRERESGPEGRNWVVVTVSDSGVGIPAALHDRVFDPFFTTKAPGEGAGLGLSMVDAAVRECGGRVSLRSDQGAGTIIDMRLPSAEPPLAGPCRAAKAPRHPRTASPILIVEDEGDVARMVSAILEAHGYTTLRARTGIEALERVHERHGGLGLVILDLVLPDLGGDEVYRLLSALAPEVAVLLMTGREDKARTLAPGTPVLPKPFTPEELLSSVAELLRGGRRHAAGPPGVAPGSR